MHLKFFTRLFLLIGIIGLFSVPLRADEIQIGSGNSTDYNLPTHSNWDYSLTQQIYTAEEIETAGGGNGTINSISFYNAGSEKTRTLDVYLANTDKASFANSSDWIAITSSNLVYSGSVTFTAGAWTTITFTTPFAYDGSNLAVIVDDNTGSYSSGLSCRIYTASSTQSIYSRRDNNNIDPSDPINGTPVMTKNQIKLDIEFASETCAKPKNLNATNITAHAATLTWTAGAEGQSNWEVFVTTDATMVPDENTTPTYQVTECSKSLSNLATQTTYYAYVRSACGGSDGNSKWAKKVFTTTREALTVDASHPYSQDFETNNDWGFANGTLTNQWCWGSAVNNGGTKSMYVSKDGGTTYEYAHGNTAIYASKLFNFAQGTYTFFFDWNTKGESTYDYLRVALAPGDVEYTAGTNLYSGVGTNTLPDNWIALDGGSKLNLSDGWQTKTTEASISGTYTMVYIWRNDGSGGNQPPAAIDNISISYMSCPRPTSLTASNITGRTATLSWTENGTATNWVLQYATNNGFTENLVETNVSGTASKDLSGLSPETKYYARVKSVLGNEESSWSDVKDFTTTATCEKPTNWKYTPYSATAYSGGVEWEGNANGYNIAYRPTTDFDPSNETLQDVTRITLGSVNAYTLQNLTPETKYYVYIQADCGAEDGTSSWSNRVFFTTEATCRVPSGLSTTATSTTITLSWTAGAEGQDAWDIRYKKSTDSDYTYIHLDNHPATSYTITDLSPVTTYSVNVRAWCDEDDQSKWGASSANQNYDQSVTTECAALTLPYTCDFEGAVETTGHYSSYPMPKCWNRIEMQYGSYSYSYYPYVFNNSSDAHSGTKSLRMYRTPNSANETAILPEIDEAYEMNNLQIKFWAKAGSSNNTLSVGIMENDVFAEVQIVEGISTTYAEYTVLLANYTGSGRNIAIKCGSSSSYLYYYIDDILVEEIPSCFIPTGFDNTAVDVNTATFVWQAGNNETAWNLQYKKASDSNWSETIAIDETTYTLTGLQRATVYEARVQAICATDDQSDWTGPISFTTECGIWPIDAQHPLMEDFDDMEASDFPPICWDKFNHEMNSYSYWYLNANNGLNSPAAYSSWNEGYAFLVMPKMHIDGKAILSFDYLIGSGNYNESCAVVVSTGEMTFTDFSQTIWTADGNNLPSGKANATVSLSGFDDHDIYIAFKYKGSGTSGCTWYIDNVQLYVNTIHSSTLVQGWNWWAPTVQCTLSQLEDALEGNGLTIKAADATYSYSNGAWSGTNSDLIPGQMYRIQTSEACTLTLSGLMPTSVSVTLNPGYNQFGYTGNATTAIAEAFGNGFTPTAGDKVVSQNGGFAIYNGTAWEGTLATLVPGQGYVYVAKGNTAQTVNWTKE